MSVKTSDDSLSLNKLLINKELRINYVPEIRNGCNLWEQAFRCYCVDPLVLTNGITRGLGLARF